MIDIVIGVNPERISIHPRGVRNLCVKSQRDIHISIIPYSAMKGRRVWIGRYYEIRIGKWIVAVGLYGVLGDSLDCEHEE